MKNLLVKTALCFLISAPLAEAQMATALQQANTEANRKTMITLLLDTSSTLARQADNSAGEDLSFSGFYRVDLGVPLSRALTATLRAGYSQEYSYALPDNSSGYLTDSRLGLMYGLGEIREGLSLTLSSNLTLPTSRESRRAGLQTAASVSAMFIQRAGKWTFQVAPGWTEFFHDVITQNNGTQNLSRSMSVLGVAAYDIIPELTASVSVMPIHSYTYLGTPRDTYFLGYDFTYAMSSKVFLSLGVYNRASILRTNGLDYNYALFDRAQFMGYFDVTLIL